MIRAFLLGMYEFRRSFTTSFVGHGNEYSKYEWYDRGRELSHRITLRKYEGSA